MDFLNKMERKFGRYAIPNLMLYIILLNGAGLLLSVVYPESLFYLCWSTRYILKGQIWRLITFIMVPYETNPLNFLLFAFVYYSISQTLERMWGTFRMNMYIITGILGMIIAGFAAYFILDVDLLFGMHISYLCNSLFLALAAVLPDTRFMLMFIIPIKAKWMAALSAVMYLYDLMSVVNQSGWMPYGFASLLLIGFSLLNFVLYFTKAGRIRSKEVKRRTEFKKKMGQTQNAKPVHKCTICGRTDKDFPELEFRYCSKCDGTYEYCNEHLYTHKHITAHSYEEQ